MVYTTCVSTIRKTALDPTIGSMHESGDRRFTLSLDVAAIYEPILADRVLFRLVNRRQVGLEDFETELDGCLLTEDGRLTVLAEYEDTLDRTVEHPRLKRKVSYKTLVQTDVYSLKKACANRRTVSPDRTVVVTCSCSLPTTFPLNERASTASFCESVTDELLWG